MSNIIFNNWHYIHGYILTLVRGLLLFVLVTYALGAVCRDNQQCSDCDAETTGCLTPCYPGYFGHQCRSVCSSHCRNNTCELIPSRGVGRCTEGCEPGYQGSNCVRPCDSHTVPCTPCPWGCDGEYCHRGRTCHEGCKQAYYGLECKTCSDKCKVCNRKTGICEECREPYFGGECEHSCVNCEGSCRDGCTKGCVPGFYGPFCAQVCSERCRPPHTSQTGELCREDVAGLPTNCTSECREDVMGLTANCTPECREDVMGLTANCTPECRRDAVGLPTNCTPECHIQSGECTHGCTDGWYGPQCASPCNPGCRHRRCSDSGDCIEGCVEGRWGPNCESCSENCLNHACHPNTGVCVHGCKSGHHGEFCNITCRSCSGDACQQTVNCTSNSTVQEDLAESYNSSIPRTGGPPTVAVTLTVTFAVFGLAATSLCCLLFSRRRSHRRQKRTDATHGDTPRRRDTPSSVYQELELYWEIREEDIDMQRSPHNQDAPGVDGDTEMPVLADCFSGGNDAENEDDDDDRAGTSTRTSTDYTHLLRGVSVDAAMVVSYISPLGDELDSSVA